MPKFFIPYGTGEALASSPWKSVFFSCFFLQKISFYLCVWIFFFNILSTFLKKKSFPSRFWEYWCSVFDPISLVNENNRQFCIFIIKKCHFPCDSYAFSPFKWKSFSFGFTFSFDNFIWIIKKVSLPLWFRYSFPNFLENLRFSFDL